MGLKQAVVTYKQVLKYINWIKARTPYIELLIDIADKDKQQEFLGFDLNNPKWEDIQQLLWIIFCKYVIKQKKILHWILMT